MAYSEDKLPSNGNIRIQCKEYSVADAIAVSSMNPKLVERFTSKFLEVIQTGQDIHNPREMTIHDRKTLVFKYALAAIEQDNLFSDDPYTVEDCPHCGESHTFRLSLADFQKSINNIIRNQTTEALTEFDEQRIRITPILGIHAEQLEQYDNALKRIAEKDGEDSDEYQAQRIKRDMYELLCQFEIVTDGAQLKQEQQAERDKKWLHGLSVQTFAQFKNLVATKQEEIKHGIDFRYTFFCPNKKEQEGPVVVLLPFRCEDFINRI